MKKLTTILFLIFLLPAVLFAQRGKLYTGLATKEFYKNGSLRVHRNYKNHKIQGYKTFYKSGQLRSSYIFNSKGQHDSIANFYYPNGNIKTIWEYKKGKKKKRIDYTLKGDIIKGKKDYVKLKNYGSKGDDYNLASCFHRARISSKLGYYDESLEDYNYVLSKISTERLKYWAEKSLYHYLGRNYIGIENYKKAMEYNFKALSTRRADKKPLILNNLGFLFFKAEAYTQAMKYIDKSLALNPNGYFAFFNKAKIYLALGDLNNALNFIEKTIADKESHKLSKKDVAEEKTIWVTRAEIYFKLGRYEDAIKDIEKALKENPVNSYAFKYLALSYKKLNQQDNFCKALLNAEKYKHDKIYSSTEVSDLIKQHCK